MKKVALAFVVLLSCVSASFAQPAPVAAAVVKPEVKVFTGKVAMVVVADAVKGTKASIVVIDEKQLKESFSVTPATVITDAADKPVALGVLANGETVKVAFTLKDGEREAVAIKAVK